MTKIRTRVPCPTAAVLILLSALAVPVSGMAAPYLPSDDTQVLERLPTPGDAPRRELRRLRSELANDPTNLASALRLARRYFELARAEADPRYNGYAETALAPWWDLREPPAEVLVLRANLRQNRHRFDDALADLDRVLARQRRHPQALLTRAFVLQVQGDHAAARETCRRLPSTVGGLIAATCLGRMDSLSGRAGEAETRLRRALVRDTSARPQVRLWALTNLAEIEARLGRDEAAERHFQEAMSLDIRNVYLLGAYADLLLDQGRDAEVRDLLEAENRVDGLLLRRALAASRLDDAEAVDLVAILNARFEASRRRGDTRHRREEARFSLELLDEPLEALRLAEENWRVQKEPWDARLLLDAAFSAERPEAAAGVAAWVERSGIEDPAILSLAARIGEIEQ